MLQEKLENHSSFLASTSQETYLRHKVVAYLSNKQQRQNTKTFIQMTFADRGVVPDHRHVLGRCLGPTLSPPHPLLPKRCHCVWRHFIGDDVHVMYSFAALSVALRTLAKYDEFYRPKMVRTRAGPNQYLLSTCRHAFCEHGEGQHASNHWIRRTGRIRRVLIVQDG